MTGLEIFNKLSRESRAAAYDKGYIAALNMVSVNKNPYFADTEEGQRQAWFDGYRDGEKGV